MVWLRRATGLLALLLGAVGCIASLAGVVEVWRLRGQVDDLVVHVSTRLDDILARVEERSGSANRYIDQAQDSLEELNVRVQRRVAESRDVPLEEAADIDEIERQLYARLQLAGDVISLIGSTADLIEQLSSAFQSASAFVKQDTRTLDDLVGALRDGKQEMRRTRELADEVKFALAEVRENRNVEENAKRIRTISSFVDKSLTKVEEHAECFDRGVVKTRAEFGDLFARIRERLVVIAVALTLIMVWIAVAQTALAGTGWRLIRG